MSRKRSHPFLVLLAINALFWCRPARSDLLGIEAIIAAGMDALLTQELSNAMVKAFGLGFDFRAYEPATPLGSKIGLDIGISAAAVEVPADFVAALATVGMSSFPLPVIPDAKIGIVHKGLGDWVDVGGTYLPPTPYTPGMWLWGVNLKVAVFQPEEGPVIALRGSFTQFNFPMTQDTMTMTLRTQTITPEVLISRKMSFVEPYLGLGYQYAYGDITVTQDNPEPLNDVTRSRAGVGQGLKIFGGLAFRIPFLGIRITTEGGYGSSGMNFVGAKIGVAF